MPLASRAATMTKSETVPFGTGHFVPLRIPLATFALIFSQGRCERRDDVAAGHLGRVRTRAIRADNIGGNTFYDRVGFVYHRVEHAAPLKDGTPVDRISKLYLLNSGGETPPQAEA